MLRDHSARANSLEPEGHNTQRFNCSRGAPSPNRKQWGHIATACLRNASSGWQGLCFSISFTSTEGAAGVESSHCFQMFEDWSCQGLRDLQIKLSTAWRAMPLPDTGPVVTSTGLKAELQVSRRKETQALVLVGLDCIAVPPSRHRLQQAPRSIADCAARGPVLCAPINPRSDAPLGRRSGDMGSNKE